LSHWITEPCIGTKDHSCVEVCPVDCIHPRKDEPDFEVEEMLYIDPDTCIDCGLCVDECPVKAIFPEDSVPEQWKHFMERNREYYARKATG
jgi:ferredoxin